MVDLRYEEPRCKELPSVVSPPNDWVAVNRRRTEILYIYRDSLKQVPCTSTRAPAGITHTATKLTIVYNKL